MSGGAIVIPIFHEIIPINMNALKLEAEPFQLSDSPHHPKTVCAWMSSSPFRAWQNRLLKGLPPPLLDAGTSGRCHRKDYIVLVEISLLMPYVPPSQMTVWNWQDTRENFRSGHCKYRRGRPVQSSSAGTGERFAHSTLTGPKRSISARITPLMPRV